MKDVAGWWLPKGDEYFAQFIEGDPGKSNGFQRDHLEEAFKHVKRWLYAIDVGAHVGFWTVPMAQRFAQVWAFEPSPETFDCLQRNLVDHPNVVIKNVAVGDKPGWCTVHEHEQSTKKSNTGGRFVTPNGGSVRMTSLDHELVPGCDLLKVDVEGFESMVLRGAKEMIRVHRPVIIMETDKKFARSRYGIDNTEAEHFLLKRGYHVVNSPRSHCVGHPSAPTALKRVTSWLCLVDE